MAHILAKIPIYDHGPAYHGGGLLMFVFLPVSDMRRIQGYHKARYGLQAAGLSAVCDLAGRHAGGKLHYVKSSVRDNTNYHAGSMAMGFVNDILSNLRGGWYEYDETIENEEERQRRATYFTKAHPLAYFGDSGGGHTLALRYFPTGLESGPEGKDKPKLKALETAAQMIVPMPLWGERGSRPVYRDDDVEEVSEIVTYGPESGAVYENTATAAQFIRFMDGKYNANVEDMGGNQGGNDGAEDP